MKLPKISFFSVTSTKLWCAATVPVDSFWFYIPSTAYHVHCVCVPLEVLQSLVVNHVLLLLFPSTEMYHLLPFLLLLTSATGDGNFRFTSTHVIVNETPFTQASFGISRTAGQAEPVTLTCQVSTGCQIIILQGPVVWKVVKLITNRWAWALVLIMLVEPGNALAWGEGIHGNPASGPTRHRHTEQFSGILTDQCLPSPYLKREGGKGKTKVQNGMQTASYCNNTLGRTTNKQLCI